ncbi:MAG: ABC transporter ATP-binding protein [Gemmobacter sp.]|nr:ABC transporter ATP-binding protein [Gemmobacter sp.]
MIEVRGLERHYTLHAGLMDRLRGARQQRLRAVDGVSFDIGQGEVLGLVGESGCGKSTTGRLLVGLEDPGNGSVSIGGEDAIALRQRDRKAFHRRVQMVFQDPYGSLNPHLTIAEIVARPLIYQGHKRGPDVDQKVRLVLEQAGLTPADQYLDRYPHQISGGQRQRVGIARAIVLDPSVLIADEPISMLDVSIKWGIIRLLKRLVAERGISLLYITHDLATVGAICDRIAIMYLGRIVEIGPVDQVLAAPRHPYTAALVSAIPVASPGKRRAPPDILGSIPDAADIPPGCRFGPRCPRTTDLCRAVDPDMTGAGDWGAACHHQRSGAVA